MSAIARTLVPGWEIIEVSKIEGQLPVYTRTTDGVKGHPHIINVWQDFVRVGDLCTHATNFIDVGVVVKVLNDHDMVEIEWPDGAVTKRQEPRVIVWEDDDREPVMQMLSPISPLMPAAARLAQDQYRAARERAKTAKRRSS